MSNDKYIKWAKGVNLQLNVHFNTHELECKCDFVDCGEQRISKDLLERLSAVRAKLGAALYITSAFRCLKKQNALRRAGLKTAAGKSQHELGNAADVYTTGDMKKLGRILEEEFNAIGTAKTFYHVDTRDDKERRWLY